VSVRFEGIPSILRVENMQASLRFYVDVLGFENASWATATSLACRAMEQPFTYAPAIRAERGSGSA
jgi:catechol 2,3-dioxygenase-like lactoylglutathione lyase family enzyme